MIKFVKTSPFAIVPKFSKKGDAGADLTSIEDGEILPLSRAIFRTGLCVEIPEDYYIQISPRSGLAAKNGIDTLAGVIDSGYRSEVKVILYNTDKEKTYKIHKGDRIAQIIILKYFNFEFKEVESLSESDRGIDGFGSTGIN